MEDVQAFRSETGTRASAYRQRGSPRTLKQRLQSPEGFHSYGEIQQWLVNRLTSPINKVYQLVRYQLKAKLKVPGLKALNNIQKASPTLKKLLALKFLQEEFVRESLRYLCQDETRLGLKQLRDV